MHKFIKQTEQVLNSNTIFFSVELPQGESNAIAFIEQSIKTGKFCEYAGGELMKFCPENPAISNLEWMPLKVSFEKFKEVLVDMLVVNKVHFHDAPYGGRWDEKYATILVEEFWLSILIDNPTRESEEQWAFYTMPRDYVNSTKEELEFLQTHDSASYRPMSIKNTDNPLGKYFCGFGGDCFLIFHTDKRVYCLLTNGCD